MQLSDQCKRAVDLVKDQIMSARSKNEYYETEPGNVLLQEYPDVLKELSQGIRSIVVTGTNGKTTTCRLISSIFNEAGIEHISNPEGANMTSRFATVFCDNYLDGENGKNTAVLESDELYVRRLLTSVECSCLVITNIFSDQISRLQSEEHVAEQIAESMRIAAPSVCFISKECHFLEKFLAVPDWKFIFFDDESLDAIPVLQIPGSYNRKNAQAARAVARFWGIDDNLISAGLSKTKPAFGRFETIKTDNCNVTICLAKNPQGFHVVNEWLLKEDHSPYTRLVLAFNHNAGDDRDTNWLLQNDYKGISAMFNTIYITGNCSEEIKEQISLSGGTSQEVTMESLPQLTANGEGDMLIIANYSAMMTVRCYYNEAGYTQEYWKC